MEPNDDQMPAAPKVQAFCSVEVKGRSHTCNASRPRCWSLSDCHVLGGLPQMFSPQWWEVLELAPSPLGMTQSPWASSAWECRTLSTSSSPGTEEKRLRLCGQRERPPNNLFRTGFLMGENSRQRPRSLRYLQRVSLPVVSNLCTPGKAWLTECFGAWLLKGLIKERRLEESCQAGTRYGG